MIEACRLRLRPILMTSFAFILGVLPLVVAEGAGAEMRRTLGLAVFSGMLGVTLFGIFLTPVFYDVIQRFGKPPTPIGATPALEAHAGEVHPTADAHGAADAPAADPRQPLVPRKRLPPPDDKPHGER